MDIDKIINIVREQNLKVGRKLPADLPGLGGGGGGTNALTAQAKVRTLGASLRSLIGGDDRLAKQSFNDPQRYLDDKDYKNRGTYADYKRRQADQVLKIRNHYHTIRLIKISLVNLWVLVQSVVQLIMLVMVRLQEQFKQEMILLVKKKEKVHLRGQRFT